MAPSDSADPFQRIPWCASLLRQSNIITRVPGSRKLKPTGEDSLFADILKTPRTIRSCLSYYIKPSPSASAIEEVSTLMTLGDGLNGHPGILHGGIVATIIDEGMGILQSANFERDHLGEVAQGRAHGELPPEGYSFFTAELTIKYLKPVMTGQALVVSCREGRKEWIFAEVKQRVGVDEDYEGDEVVCATGEALFIRPKKRPSKL
ncbi:hypothetical protein LTR09_005148 [Extremus antarcticus]|uniref:Thioesterase domain-containing protein n=1 Tax=Extremus antarcticus TaxID=702011 RepID=A0AAJ0DNX0_9PEZI|nr:hypothetical protein LTR09_005148 [Extremus antarcticus]